MAEWQTHKTQNLARATSCGFKSHLPQVIFIGPEMLRSIPGFSFYTGALEFEMSLKSE